MKLTASSLRAEPPQWSRPLEFGREVLSVEKACAPVFLEANALWGRGRYEFQPANGPTQTTCRLVTACTVVFVHSEGNKYPDEEMAVTYM